MKIVIVAGVVAGLVSLVVGGWRRRRRDEWVRRSRHAAAGAPAPQPALPGRVDFASIRSSVLGLSKDGVAETLGPPPAASVVPPTHGAPAKPPASFRDADVWYYPLDPQRQVAVAITFAGGVADRIEWLAGPEDAPGTQR